MTSNEDRLQGQCHYGSAPLLGYLQHIGKIDGPPEVVIFLHICKIAIFVFLSMYHQLGDSWFLLYDITTNSDPS